MLLAILIVIISFMGFYSPSEWWATNFIQIEIVLMAAFGWLVLEFKANRIKWSSIFCIMTIHAIIVLSCDWYISYMNNFNFTLYYTILLLLCLSQELKNYNIESDKINRKNVCHLFRKPRTFIQFLTSLFGAPTCSFGSLIGDLFQLRRGYKTIQRIKCKDSYIEENYYVKDTGYPISKISQEDINILLEQRARQPNTLWLRLNCLRSFRHILNQIPGYECNKQILPSMFLRRLYK